MPGFRITATAIAAPSASRLRSASATSDSSAAAAARGASPTRGPSSNDTVRKATCGSASEPSGSVFSGALR